MPVGRAAPKAPRSCRPFRRNLLSRRSATAADRAGRRHRRDRLFRQRRRAAPRARHAVAGKIVFIDHHMMPAQDGSGYGQFGAPRRQGPTIASLKGAIGIVIRSIGTDITATRTPASNISSTARSRSRPAPCRCPMRTARPDPQARQAVTMHLTLVSQKSEGGHSGNVIAEVPGRDPRRRSSSSAATSTAGISAREHRRRAGRCDHHGRGEAHHGCGRPARTIRVVWFGAEEPGGFGGKAYADAHGKEPLCDRRRKRFRRRPRSGASAR